MSLTRFGDALILAVSSCPKWPRQRDLKNVPGQAKDLNSLFQDLGFCTWHPDQEELTQQGVKDAVANLCQRTERNLQEMSEENCLVTVAVLSHGRKRAASELPDMVCYDSFGEHIDSNDADLDEVLIDGFCSIHVPEGKSLKVWLLLDCCQSNEEMNRWRAPEKMTKLERRCFGDPSHVDFLFFFPCDPGREAHDYFSMSKAITEVLTCRVQPITVYDACRSAMKLVQKWSGRTVRPRIVERGDFGDIWFLGRLPDHSNLAPSKRFLLQLIGFLKVFVFLMNYVIIIMAIMFFTSLVYIGIYWYRRAPRIDFLPAFPTGHICSFNFAVCLCLCSVYCLAEVRSREMVREIQKMVSERSGSGFLARVRNMFGFNRAEERLCRAIESHKWWRTLARVVFVMILLWYWYHWYPGMDLPFLGIATTLSVIIVNCLL